MSGAHKGEWFVNPVRVAVTLSEPRMQMLDSPEFRQILQTHCDVRWNPWGRDLHPSEIADFIGDADMVLTSWGSPPLSTEDLDRLRQLKVVAHAAGTVKHLVPQDIFSRGIVVLSGASRIAQSVAEYCLAGILGWLNHLESFSQQLHRGGWRTGELRRHELFGTRVGVVSASLTGRRLIRLLAPFGCEVRVYDPYLSQEEAESLGVERASLEEVLASAIVSVHAPALAATHHLLDRHHLAHIPDGAIFVNSSRGSVVDEAALHDELVSGRFVAVLDVFDHEPLASDHPLRRLPNVVLTPHVAGDTWEGRRALLPLLAKEALKCIDGQASDLAVSRARFATLA